MVVSGFKINSEISILNFLLLLLLISYGCCNICSGRHWCEWHIRKEEMWCCLVEVLDLSAPLPRKSHHRSEYPWVCWFSVWMLCVASVWPPGLILPQGSVVLLHTRSDPPLGLAKKSLFWYLAECFRSEPVGFAWRWLGLSYLSKHDDQALWGTKTLLL